MNTPKKNLRTLKIRHTTCTRCGESYSELQNHTCDSERMPKSDEMVSATKPPRGSDDQELAAFRKALWEYEPEDTCPGMHRASWLSGIKGQIMEWENAGVLPEMEDPDAFWQGMREVGSLIDGLLYAARLHTAGPEDHDDGE